MSLKILQEIQQFSSQLVYILVARKYVIQFLEITASETYHACLFWQHCLSKHFKIRSLKYLYLTDANILCFNSTFLAFIYGVLVNNTKLIFVNLLGFTLESIYIIIYFYYLSQKVNKNLQYLDLNSILLYSCLSQKKLLKNVGFLVFFMLLITAYTFILEEMSKTALYFVGYLGSIVAIVMYGAPLSSIVYIRFIILELFLFL